MCYDNLVLYCKYVKLRLFLEFGPIAMDSQKKKMLISCIQLFMLIYKQRSKRKKKLQRFHKDLQERMAAMIEACSSFSAEAAAILATKTRSADDDGPARSRPVERMTDYFDRYLWPGPEHVFKSFLRVNKATFTFLCDGMRNLLSRENAVRPPVSVERRVAVCLYYLGSSGECRNPAALFGVAPSTACEILHEVCDAIIETFRARFLRFPTG